MKTTLRKAHFIPCTLLVLAGCGGGGGANSFNLLPATVTSGLPTYDLTYLEATDMYRLDVSGDLDFIPGDPALDLNGFDRSSNPVSGTGLLVSRGDLTETSLFYSESGGANLVAGQYGRLAPSTFSSNQTFTADGGYVGFITNSADGSLVVLITGDVELAVDFESETFRGDITNRRLRDPGNNGLVNSPVEDMVLITSTIDDDGSVLGGITGGGLSGVVVNNASYEGLIDFDTGVEGVGIVRLDHSNAVGVLNEVGSFAAGHD